MTSAHRRALQHAEEQQGLCFWCSRPMHVSLSRPDGGPEPWYLSLEHLRKKGDPEYAEATVAAHVLCNVLREVLAPSEFSTYVHSVVFEVLYQRTFERRRVTMRSRAIKSVVRKIAKWQAIRSSQNGPSLYAKGDQQCLEVSCGGLASTRYHLSPGERQLE